LDNILSNLATLLSNPHAQSLKQYTINYESLYAAQESLDSWLKVQNKMV
jgi:hypothetical protein